MPSDPAARPPAAPPAAETFARLREYGARSVILHTDRSAVWPQFGAEYKPVKGLGLKVIRRGPLVIYELDPPSAGSGAGAAEGSPPASSGSPG